MALSTGEQSLLLTMQVYSVKWSAAGLILTVMPDQTPGITYIYLYDNKDAMTFIYVNKICLSVSDYYLPRHGAKGSYLTLVRVADRIL